MNLTRFLDKFDTSELYEIKDVVDRLIRDRLGDKKDIRLIDLHLSVRALNCLRVAKFTYLHELCAFTYIELLRIRNMGMKSMSEILEQLDSHGLSLRENKK